MTAAFLIRAGGLVGSSLLDGSESDGTQLFAGNAAMTSDWTGVNATLTASVTTAPNGATDAASLIENSSNVRHIIYQQRNGIITADGTCRVSIYAKATGRRYLMIQAASNNGTAGNAYAYFDLQSPGAVTDSGVTGGAQSASNASITAAASSFYKCSVDMRLSATTNNVYFIYALSNVGAYGAPLEDDNPQYTGDGSSGHYLWRPKLVQL